MKVKFLSLIIALVLVQATFSLAVGQWHTETVESFLAGPIFVFSDIVVDQAGKAHIAYFDNHYHRLIYANNSSGSWQKEIIDTIDSNISTHPSIALDSTGHVHIIYTNKSNDGINYALKHATNLQGNWQIEEIVLASGNCDNSITIDSENKVHVSYSCGSLKYATNRSGSWQIENIDTNGSNISIALDSTGYTHISYYYNSNKRELRHATNALGYWEHEIVDSGGDVGSFSSIAIDLNGYVHISYRDNTYQSLKYATDISESWQIITVVDGAENVGDSSMALDSSGNVHISYHEQENGNLKYATNASGIWVTETVDGAGNVGDYNSIAIGPMDKVHISYYDSSNSYLKYATNWIGPVLHISKDAEKLTQTGSDLVYTLSYSNSGTSEATGVVVTDTVPAYTTFVTATGNYTVSGNIISWNIGNLSPGGSGQVSFIVAISDALSMGSLINNTTYSINSNQTETITGTPFETTVYACGPTADSGDVNDDGDVNVLDAIRVLRISLGLE